MSDLKHRSAKDLREIIQHSVETRAKIEAEAALADREAARLTRRAASLRKQSWNMGQRECWARKYLAEKT